MKSNILVELLALFSSTLAFRNPPLSTHTLILGAKDVHQRREPTKLQPARRDLRPLQSSSVPSPSNETSSPLVTGFDALSTEHKEQLTLMFRSSFCAASSLATWAMVKHTGMTIVQASAVQGLLGCLALPKPNAMAWFC